MLYNDDNSEYSETYEGLAKDGYKFLRAYFKWDGTIDRQIHRIQLLQEDRRPYIKIKKKTKDILL